MTSPRPTTSTLARELSPEALREQVRALEEQTQQLLNAQIERARRRGGSERRDKAGRRRATRDDLGVPFSNDRLLARRVQDERDRCAGLLFTSTPRDDLVEVARWQLLADQAWAGQVRHLVTTTNKMSATERDFAGDETALALGLSPETGRALIWQAGQITSLPGLLESVECGRISQRHVRACLTVLDESALNLEQRQAVTLIALARYADHTPSAWAQLIRRLVLSVDPRSLEKRKAERAQDRRISFYPVGDEHAGLTLQAPLELIARVEARVHAEATALKATGDPRTLEQLRCDLSLALLADGRLDGQPPAIWTVNVLIPLNTLNGGDEPGEIPGWGPILGSTARDLATQGGEFTQVLTNKHGHVAGISDPLTPNQLTPAGPATAARVRTAPDPATLLEQIRAALTDRPLAIDPGTLATRSYRPNARLIRFLEARDRTCVFPGCRRQASRTDKDHRTPWPTGATDAHNLQCLCRRHHRAKQALFTIHREPDGTLIWITRSGWWFRRRPQGS